MAREAKKSTDWREEIGKVIDEDGKDETPEKVEKEEKPEKAEKVEKSTKAPEEAGADEEPEKIEEPEAEEPAPIEEKIDPPAHFTAEEKKHFEGLPIEQQKWIAGSTNRMISNTDRKLQELSNYQRRTQAFDEILAPYRQQMAMNGMEETTVLKQLFSAYDYLRRDPVNGIRWLAQSYGVDLGQAQAEQSEIDPALGQVMQQVTQVQQGFQQLQNTIQSDKQQQMLSVVNKFADEKDAQGNLKHPHFEAVIDNMMKLIQAKIVPADDLETAYTRAVGFAPELVPAAPIPQKPTQAKDAVTEAAEKAARAKKASAGIKSGAGSPKTDAPKSRRQEIEDLVDAQLKS